MKKVTVQLVVFIAIFGSFIYGCSPNARYKRMLKRELASGVRYDSLFMGLYFGMTQKDFYMHCWKLNRDGIIKQGPSNTSVEYLLKKELKYPGTMNFYPGFVDSKIAELPVKFVYTGWAPWNRKLSSDSLQLDVLQWFKKMYGDDFMEVGHPEKGTAFIKVNGNRRITIFNENDMYVWAVFTDMSIEKQLNDTTGSRPIQEDITKDLK
jgi:hypothetical protein